MDVKEFARGLFQLIGKADGMRPLLCDGNPHTCAVAVVGINPRTTTPFWPFWNGERGMDRESWIKAYLAQHDGKFSRSRAAIERFVPQVAARVIELNSYAAQSKRIADLGRSHRKTDLLGFVLAAVRPRVIVCAGARAHRTVQKMSLTWSPTVLAAKHFIYWGRGSERELAKHINQLLGAASGRPSRRGAAGPRIG